MQPHLKETDTPLLGIQLTTVQMLRIILSSLKVNYIGHRGLGNIGTDAAKEEGLKAECVCVFVCVYVVWLDFSMCD